MNFTHRRRGEATKRLSDRQQREDAAPRLAEQVPDLRELHLELVELRSGMELSESVHIRRVLVQNAAALFDLPCLDPHCAGGGHDVTHEIISALRSRRERITGEDACQGTNRGGQCGRVLSYVAVARYAPSSSTG